MKRFNLTFRGEILPQFNTQQVKARFAELFALSDHLMIDEIFSGDNVILRSNLDRKTAAEFFMHISDAGGVVQVVGALTEHV